MHGIGRAVEERKRSRHMWTVPTRAIVDAAADGSSSSSANSFCKLRLFSTPGPKERGGRGVALYNPDGRKISVGDCALFKPPQDSPPFIGIIRWLAAGKEDKLKVGVNWLYRPSEVKLSKDVQLEAAPNEIFYSFHKDEILAASLLHPCKVAFLPKGVELPSGISSFVCRQVYDVTNKCLWWLTDQDYIDERQEEVDQLLHKTRIEMHATLQSGGRSPKPMSGPTSTSQLKASDSVQNSTSSVPSQVKGKKRERGDQGSDPVKRERPTKADDGDSGHSRLESNLKSETAKITEKGALVDFEGVERLVQLMLPDRTEKKIDLAGRSMLVGVIAATDKFDYLNRFVQLRGLPVLDEWLQEVHKGKIGDGTGSKDGDKYVEEFLLVLLRALDKLPVNLHALQMCNIGKSVNLLRSHKNLEIQKKARSLVDTWKKRVEAEMNINDAKSGSNQAVPWPARARLPEVSHGGNRHAGASTDVAVKSSAPPLSASKTAPVKVVQGESTSRSASASPGSTKSVSVLSPAQASTNLKDGQARHAVGVTSDLPLTTVRDEKSSSSSQSHNSQSCSSDQTKTGGLSGKDDARSPAAGSMSGNKISSGSSRHRKSINGLPGSTLSVVQKDSGSNRSSMHKNSASEKQSHSPLLCEKAVDGAVNDSHKLIVKIPNRVRSPAQSASGALFEDPSIVNSRASSPVLSEKLDQFDRCSKEKSDAYRANITSDVNTESWQSNDFKDVLTGSDEGDASPAAITDEERPRTGDDSKKLAEAKAASSSGNEPKPGNAQEASLRSMNALIESCVKYSEANVSMSIGDDVGMNLLASVAAGEMSKSDLVSPTDSPQRNTLGVEPSCTGICDSNVKSSPVDDLAPNRSQSNQSAEVEHEKQVILSTNVGPTDGEGDPASLVSEEKPVGGHSGHFDSSSMDLLETADPCAESNGNTSEITVAAVVASSPASKMMKSMDIEEGKAIHNKKAVGGVDANALPDVKEQANGPLLDKEKVSNVVANLEVQMEARGEALLETDSKNKKLIIGELKSGVKTEETPPALSLHSEILKAMKEVLHPSGAGKDLVSENVIELKSEKNEEGDARIHVKQTEIQCHELKGNVPANPENRVLVVVSADAKPDDKDLGENLGSKEGNEQHSRPAHHKVSRASPVQETEQHEKSRGSKLTGTEADDAEECTSTAADVSSISASGVSDMDAKVEFDLNEGFTVDDGKLGEKNNFTAAGGSAAIRLVSPLPFPVSSVSGGLPASITVAAAAKGPFVPPDDLLRSRGELGWKGSAATSAFRPAEPRKTPEILQGTATTNLPDATAGKQGRPPLDIDLNVPDERVLEDLAYRDCAQEMGNLSHPTNNNEMACEELTVSVPVRCSGGLDLDLNRIGDASDMGNYLTSNSHRMDVPLVPVKSSGGLHNGAVSGHRDFDLNNGPADELNAEPPPFIQLAGSSLPSQPPISGLRMSNAEMGNFSPWFASGSTYSAVAIPTIMADRGEPPFPIVGTGGPQRLLGHAGGSNPFSPDVYRGPVLSSSPAVPFPSSPFQYPVFPFGTSFPLPSATFSGGSTTYVDSSSGGKVCFPAVHTPFLGPAGAVSSHYPRPFVVSFRDGSNNSSAESSRKWGRQGLDLNAGPGGPDVEGRDESAFPPRQLSVASSQAVADEQARMYQVAGGVLKRKEPEGGWDGYKHPSWQ
ncbi:hypothetical protein CJ030_MR8G019527 [Morella rubra]|uniref:BAH and coiled-coil domain-containing protein 1 n=1 Tax=Morella rubra TaxID=262757 RepID=A0A6A1UPX7_9ROSI|nr:hypothetical protein CJ030_MR8G019527 [Morella rubra]